MDTAAARTTLATLSPERWRRLRRWATQCSRRPDEAEDLLQDVLLAAIEAGRADDAWLHGALRKRAAFLARGAIRGRRREDAATAWLEDRDERGIGPDVGDGDAASVTALALLASRLPPASRQVLALAVHGLGPGEIQWLLRTSPAALRQRLAVIRRALRGLPAPARNEIEGRWPRRALPAAHDPRFGLRRRVLVSTGRALSAAGSHDPDGHLLLVAGSAHVSVPVGNVTPAAAAVGRCIP